MPTIVTIVGNLVKDPEERTFGEDKSVTNIRVACSDRIPDGSGGWKDGDKAYYNVSLWRNLAKAASSTLKKGDRVIVHGKLKYREYKKNDGTNGYSYEVEATDVGLPLSTKNVSTTNMIAADPTNPWATK
jgi:single-strand DNA-binding protein